MQLVRPFGPVTLGVLVGGCSALSVLDGPERNHISVANRSGYQVAMTADEHKLIVSLDTQSAVEKRLVWVASFGSALGPPSSEFDAAASDWLKIEKPECKASNGRRISFGSYEYDLVCQSAAGSK